jgi:transposase
MMKGHRHITQEFRKEAVRLVTEHGRSVRQVAEELEIGQSTLWRWKKELSRESSCENSGRGGKDDEIRHLRRQVEQLKEERDILKKAAAYFAKESA